MPCVLYADDRRKSFDRGVQEGVGVVREIISLSFGRCGAYEWGLEMFFSPVCMSASFSKVDLDVGSIGAKDSEVSMNGEGGLSLTPLRITAPNSRRADTWLYTRIA